MGATGRGGGEYQVIPYLAALLLFAAYQGWRWSRVRPRRAIDAPAWRPPLDAPHVTFLVPAWNAAEDIAPFVDSFRSLNYPNKSLVLCAGGPDGSFEAAVAHLGAGIKVLRQLPGEGKQAALAKSYRVAGGAIIFLTDIDCRLDDECVNRTLKPIVAAGEAVVTGSSIPCESQHAIPAVVVQWAIKRVADGASPRYFDGLLGRNCAVTREAVEAIGRFNFPAPTGTDFRMAQELKAAGYRIWFEPRSEMRTEYPWPLSVLVRKQGRWLRNVLLYAKHPRQTAEFGDAALVSASPFVVVLLALSSLLAHHPLPLFIAVLLLLHGVANRLLYVRTALDSRFLKPSLAVGSLLELLGTMAAGAYATFSLLTPTMRRRW